VSSARANYRALVAKVDAFVERVSGRHAADLRCVAGCAQCCHVRLTITAIEADAISVWAAAQSPDRRVAIATAAQVAANPTRCAALDDEDRCRIYAARPLVCRSHGIPIRLHARGLPVITSCELNFTAAGPAAADADCILDQQLVSTTLAAIDRSDLSQPAPRVELAALLAALS
jgi:uncharacterized protein